MFLTDGRVATVWVLKVLFSTPPLLCTGFPLHLGPDLILRHLHTDDLEASILASPNQIICSLLYSLFLVHEPERKYPDAKVRVRPLVLCTGRLIFHSHPCFMCPFSSSIFLSAIECVAATHFARQEKALVDLD